MTATSSSTCPSTTAEPPALPHSGMRATTQEQRCTRPDPAKQPKNTSQTPNSPQNPQQRIVSPPLASRTPSVSLTTPSTPVDSPCPLPLHPLPPVLPHQPHGARKRATSLPTAAPDDEHQRPRKNDAATTVPPSATILWPPPLVSPSSHMPPCSMPTRFNWADDAMSLAITPSIQPRDLSVLRTDYQQPFGTLRRRMRRRRAPPHIFSSSRKYFHPALPPHVLSQPFIMCRHPRGIAPGKPVITIPHIAAHPPTPAPNLDWDNDPRLSDLSRALQALGWVPPC